MLVGELLVLLALVTAGGVGIRFAMATVTMSRDRRAAKEKRHAQMRADLGRALLTRDYRQLDDFMLLWGDEVDAKVAAHVKERRDELYVEDNEKVD
jgi:hypothetical protein